MEFVKAKPIWLEGLQKEMNVQAGFKTKIEKKEGRKYTVNLTCAYTYKLYVNGEFICYGPARAAHGYARVDTVDITEKLAEGENIIAIEAAGYNCSNYYLIKRDSFVIAEIFEDGEVVSATGYDFNGIRLSDRVQKCQRYSFQRTFPDVWNLDIENALYSWKTADCPLAQTQLVDIQIEYLPRHSAMPEFNEVFDYEYIENGSLDFCPTPAGVQRQIFYCTTEGYDAFSPEEFERNILDDYYQTVKNKVESMSGGGETVIREGQYVLLDMKRNYTGFIKLSVLANKDSRFLVCMDEVLSQYGVPDPACKMNTNAICEYSLNESINTYDIESFETYGFRYALVQVISGEIMLKNFGVKEYVYPMHNVPELKTDDEVLQKIYTASVETFRQNVIDIYMDCPTRERAGWLCDSYYTAQSEWLFTGKCDVEKDFTDNFLRYKPRDGIPEGMLPMCYPCDHPNQNFIPQWAIWFVLEIEQYLKRNPSAKKADYKNLCYGLINFFKGYENAEGLVEKLPKWNFIEWSKANDWVQDISYPTNMMYARLLEIAGNLYDDKELLSKCESLRAKIIEKSFDGKLFVDNAVYSEQGIAENTGNHSEVCQYYAVFFGLIDINDEKYAYLKNMMLNVFSPNRTEFPEIEKANALMGIYIRMELLFGFGMYEKLLEEIKEFFGKMADLTGTLWENNAVCASLNHGFASFAGVMIYKCIEKLK